LGNTSTDITTDICKSKIWYYESFFKR
jgi:hypothetical protein